MYIINTFCMVNIYCAFKTNFVYRKYMYVYVHIYKVHVNQMAGFSSTLCTNLSNSKFYRKMGLKLLEPMLTVDFNNLKEEKMLHNFPLSQFSL